MGIQAQAGPAETKCDGHLETVRQVQTYVFCAQGDLEAGRNGRDFVFPTGGADKPWRACSEEALCGACSIDSSDSSC